MGSLTEIKEFKYNIAASLWAKPCKIEELLERDFLKNFAARYWVERSLMWLEKDGIIYEKKNGTMYMYKSALKILNKFDYELS